jgi:hypothetical protein
MGGVSEAQVPHQLTKLGNLPNIVVLQIIAALQVQHPQKRQILEGKFLLGVAVVQVLTTL